MLMAVIKAIILQITSSTKQRYATKVSRKILLVHSVHDWKCSKIPQINRKNDIFQEKRMKRYFIIVKTLTPIRLLNKKDISF